MFFGKQKWWTQPQFSTGIDRSNPFTLDLAFAWNAANRANEVLSGHKASATNAPLSASVAGLVTNNSPDQVNTEWARQFIATSDGAGTGDFTLLVIANPAAAGGGGPEHIFAQKNDAAGAPYAQAAMFAHTNAGGAYSSGHFTFFTYAGLSISADASGACDSAYHVWIGTRVGTTVSLYKDGLLIASNSGAVQAIIQAGSQRYMAVGSRGNGTTESYRNQTAAAFGWNRGLSAREVLDISRPLTASWQLYNPRLV